MDVYKATNRKLMILGRLPDTIAGDNSWLKTHQRARDAGHVPGTNEEGRVLSAGAWSMAVNDAFVKSGLDQKAEVMLATEFNEHEQDAAKTIIKSLSRDVRDIIANKDGTKTRQEIKDAVRAFVKAKFIEELKGDPARNDGFSIYMLEIEQLIDDNYVMMIHNPEDDGANPRGAGPATDPDADPEGAKQVMVPSGTGQKIKAELAEAAAAKQASIARREAIVTGFRAILGNADLKTRINADTDAKALAVALNTAVKAEKYDAAEAALASLQEFAATPTDAPTA